MNLEKHFDKISQLMFLDFEDIKKEINNKPGLKGQVIENSFREYLRKYLPKFLDISTGFLIDVNGNETRQLDVIISDAFKTPMFFESKDIRTIPVECSYAVIEVKSMLNNEELKKIFSNLESVKRLEKKAFVPTYEDVPVTWTVYGESFNIWPIIYYIFAIDLIDLKLIKESINNFHNKHSLSVSKRIDGVFVLKKGVICNFDKHNKIMYLPDKQSHLGEISTTKCLPIMYVCLSNLFGASLPTFFSLEYLKNVKI